MLIWACSLVVKTSPSHGEDPRFNSGQAHLKKSINNLSMKHNHYKNKSIIKKLLTNLELRNLCAFSSIALEFL